MNCPICGANAPIFLCKNCEANNDRINSWFSTFKSNVLAKETKISLYLSKFTIEGEGYIGIEKVYDSENSHKSEKVVTQVAHKSGCETFEFALVHVVDVTTSRFNGQQGLLIKLTQKVDHFIEDISLYLPGLPNADEIADIIRITAEEAKERSLVKKQEYQLIKAKEDAEFFLKKYNEYIEKADFPSFNVKLEDNNLKGFYLDRDKNLVFLDICGVERIVHTAYIPFENINYYREISTRPKVCKEKKGYFGGCFLETDFDIDRALHDYVLLNLPGRVSNNVPVLPDVEHTFPIMTQAKHADEGNMVINYYNPKLRENFELELPHRAYNYFQQFYPELDLVYLEEEESTRQAIADKEAAEAKAILDAEKEKALKEAEEIKQLAAKTKAAALREAQEAQEAFRKAEETKFAAFKEAQAAKSAALREAQEAREAAIKEAEIAKEAAIKEAEIAREQALKETEKIKEQALKEAKEAALKEAEETKAAALAHAEEAKAAALKEAEEAKAAVLAEVQAARDAALKEAEEAKALALKEAEEARNAALKEAEEAKAAALAEAERLRLEAQQAIEDAERAKASAIAEAEAAKEATAIALAKAEETKASAIAEAEETKASAIAEAEETKAAALADAEETKASALAEAEETKASALAEAEETKAAALADAERTIVAAEIAKAEHLAFQTKTQEMQITFTENMAFLEAAIEAERIEREELARQEEERQRQLEMERQQEEERQRQLEIERQQEEERQRQLALERQQEEERKQKEAEEQARIEAEKLAAIQEQLRAQKEAEEQARLAEEERKRKLAEELLEEQRLRELEEQKALEQTRLEEERLAREEQKLRELEEQRALEKAREAAVAAAQDALADAKAEREALIQEANQEAEQVIKKSKFSLKTEKEKAAELENLAKELHAEASTNSKAERRSSLSLASEDNYHNYENAEDDVYQPTGDGVTGYQEDSEFEESLLNGADEELLLQSVHTEEPEDFDDENDTLELSEFEIKISKLKIMLAHDLITEEEFEQRKNELLMNF